MDEYIGRKLSFLYEHYDKKDLVVKITKPPRENYSYTRDSRIVRIKKKNNKTEVIVCNVL